MIVDEDSQILRNINDRVQRNSIENSTSTSSVGRFKLVFEYLDYSDDWSVQQPITMLDEVLGISPYFRFDYDRFDYGRIGDVGGMDEVVTVGGI